MLSKKLITVLNAFSIYELKQFKKFLHSPYYNENQEIIQLFNIINDFLKHKLPETPLYSLKKSKIWEKIYGRQVYVDIKMRRLSSDLNRLVEQFLVVKKMTQQPVHQQILLLQNLNALSLHKNFATVLRNTKHLQDKLGYRDADFHYDSYRIQSEHHKMIEQTKPKNYYLEELEMADYHLDCFYILQKLKHYCDALGYANIFAIETDIQLLPSFLDYIGKSDFLKEPHIQAYYLVTLMFLLPYEEKHFRTLKTFLNNNSTAFSKTELNILYIHLKNYCIDKKINVGQSEFFHELFDLYKTLLEKEIIIHNEILLSQPYKNIITVGLHVQAFEWVEQFIQQYTPKLPPELQENALNYNLAKVYFHQKQYKKVIDQLREVEYKNMVYALGGKLMLLKTYYELKENRALDFLIDSFSIYLRRNKLISKDVKQQYLNVLRFVKKMARVAPYDTKSIKKIHLQINNCQALADKKWIMEKINELTK